MLWLINAMRCPWCDADEDRVVDSRPANAGAAIRRRRECGACSRRYTTFERIEEIGLMVVKRDGTKEPFGREKLAAGIRSALADRPVAPTEVEDMVDRIQVRLRRRGPEVSSQLVGGEVLAALRKTDEVAYLRFASVYKDFEGAADFERELVSLQKKAPAKRRSATS
jgi:transcriptional repressor NrdR